MSKKEIDSKKAEETVKKTVDEAADVEAASVKAPDKHRKLKYGAMFYVIIALVIAVVVILNIMVNVVAKRSPVKIDITPDNRYELTDESINAVKALDKDVEVVVTSEKDYFTALRNYWESYYTGGYGVPTEIPYDMIPELLDKYSVYAQQGKGGINVKYVDLDKDPDAVAKFKKNYNGDIQRGSIVIACGDRVRVLDANEVNNMMTVDQVAMQSQQLKFLFTGESTLTSAITSVTDAHPVKVAFVKTMNNIAVYDEQGYGGYAESFEKELLTKNGYDCTDIDIAQDEISPEDYDMVVLLAPSVDFTEDIIKKFSDFLYNGGKYDRNMIYAPDVSKTNLPNIDEFLADWSIKVENNIILDETNAVGNSPSNIIVSVSDSETVGTLPNDRLPIISQYTRELTPITKNNEAIVKEVLKSSAESYSADITQDEPEYGEKGERDVVLLSQKQHSEDFAVYTSSLLVLGSPTLADQNFLQQTSSVNNASVLLGIVNNMTGKEKGVVIADKNLQSSFIAPTAPQLKKIYVTVVWIIPFIIAAVGVIVLLRRRNK
ncbi:GldG family protein [Ruminococcus sp.]|uniref:GldG family protein n=1 Tax=Ruminococcus sp. TaxID=41978 RepID=UPI002BEBFA19|nr:GldG family protein [Ruminococcus sp.]HNZ99562.1 GldG family protein [Ruminococcus sp.]HOH86322.1 GldG family protein [Ruminococcus sp.]